MNDLLTQLWDKGIIQLGVWETIYMTFISAFFAYLVGLPLGVLLCVTDKEGIHPIGWLNKLLGILVNVFGSIPFVILIVAIQQFDGNILGPYILGDSTGLPAFWVMVAIFLGGGLFGFAGMVLGVPIFAVIYAFAQEFIENLLKKKGLSPDTADYYPVPAAENEHKLSIGIFEKLKKVNVKNDKK